MWDDGETVDYFPPGFDCFHEVQYFRDGPIPKLSDIGKIITAILQITTAVSLGASFFCSPGRPEEDSPKEDSPKEDSKREKEPSSDSS